MSLSFLLEAVLNIGSVYAKKCHLYLRGAQRQLWSACGILGSVVPTAEYKGEINEKKKKRVNLYVR